MISFYSSDKQKLMTGSGNKDLVTITPDTPVSGTISTMHENNIRRLPIIDNKDKRMIGILTDRDILKIYAR
jgi:CBS domain-containing protein